MPLIANSLKGLNEMEGKNVFVIGAGSTKFGELWELGIRELISIAAANAAKSAGVGLNDVDSVFVANCFSGIVNSQLNINSICAEELGVANCVCVGGGDSSGAHAILQAANSVMSGKSRIAMAIGVEKTSDLSMSDIVGAVSCLADHEYEAYTGATLASLYGMITQKHMEKYGTTEAQIASVSVKSHSNAVNNEFAQFRFNVDADSVMKSPVVASPVRVLGSAAACDGCCAIIMCSGEAARKRRKKARLIGYGTGNDVVALHGREDITSFRALKDASRLALQDAGIGIQDISFAEVYDPFSIAEIISIEDLGISKAGDGGKCPINPSGGLKGCGHAFAANGVRQAMEAFIQLNGDAGARQVKNAKCALASCMSGTGSDAVVNIFSNE